MTPYPVQVDHVNGPFGNIGIELNFVVFDVKRANSIEQLDRVAVVRPSFELPCGADGKNCHHAIPFRVGETRWLVRNPIRNSETFFLRTLDQDFGLLLCSSFALFARGYEPNLAKYRDYFDLV